VCSKFLAPPAAKYAKGIFMGLEVDGFVLQGILEPFSKVLSYGVQNFTLKYQQLADLCFHCSRAFVRVCLKFLSFVLVNFSFKNASA